MVSANRSDKAGVRVRFSLGLLEHEQQILTKLPFKQKISVPFLPRSTSGEVACFSSKIDGFNSHTGYSSGPCMTVPLIKAKVVNIAAT